MRCCSCGAISFKMICSACERILNEPNFSLREVGDLKIYSFYGYDEVRRILHAKHTMHGAFAYKRIAKMSFAKFACEFKCSEPVNILPIDDKITHGYSHTAVLAHAMKSENLRPIYRALHATSRVSYSGKELNFRLQNPRNFKILKLPTHPVILVDDIITTGTTLFEAKTTLKNAGVEVLFALTLADARY